MKGFLRCMLVVIGFASVSACDEQPSVIYVADADATQLLQLTDAQGECAWPRRICYLTAWNGGTVSGCWSREHRHVRASFPDQEDKLVAVSEFRAVKAVVDRCVSLE
jgi:hypothetical protein